LSIYDRDGVNIIAKLSASNVGIGVYILYYLLNIDDGELVPVTFDALSI